jgi:predicted house-cleaning noncanonical NTP pyrophosphatase (MazG superfamily)
MAKIDYNKAIRDKIPEVIKKSGKKYEIKTLSDEEFLEELERKLVEEINEYQESKDVEELSDILEVIYRISSLKGTTSKQLDRIRKDKATKRGSFDNNLFLISTED